MCSLEGKGRPLVLVLCTMFYFLVGLGARLGVLYSLSLVFDSELESQIAVVFVTRDCNNTSTMCR